MLLASSAHAQTAACDAPGEVLHVLSATGGTQTLTVPPRVVRAHITLRGGRGGRGGDNGVWTGNGRLGGNGGNGGLLTGESLVLAGTTLEIVVGQAGAPGGISNFLDPGIGGVGGHGFHTGGTGGTSTYSGGGGGGGGSTSLRRGGILIAEVPGGGGGGGGGAASQGLVARGNGGSFGANGGDGEDGPNGVSGSLGGGGGNGGSASNTSARGENGQGGGGGGGGGGRFFGQGGNHGKVLNPPPAGTNIGGGGGGGAGSMLVQLVSNTSTGSGSGSGGEARICFGPPKFTLGGSVSGLTGPATLRLVASGEPAQTVTVSAGASSFQFPNPVRQAATWSISIVSASNGQDLVVVADQGRVARSDINWLRLAPRRVCRVTSPGSFGVADGRNGSNWTTQARTLHAALADSGCTELWVKSGVYPPNTTSNPTISFRIARNVKLYGGFAGTETALAQRLPIPANRSILTGDMGGNDDNNNADGNFITEDASEIVGGNSHHVLYLDGTTSAGDLTASTLIDNVVITAGDADGSGMDGAGGGLVCFADATDRQCSPTLSNLTFAGNDALGNGGAIFNNASATGADASPSLLNVTFSGNRSTDRGSAMYNDGRNGGRSSPRLRHVSLSRNTATASSALIYTDADNSAPGSLDLDHVLSWNNGSGTGFVRRGNVTTTVRHSLIQGGCAAIAGANCGSPSTNLASDPLLGMLAFNGGLTPTLLPATGSPAIDGGNSSSCAGTDQRGVARPQDGDINGSVACDIGAVEIDAPGMSLGVSVSGNGSGSVSADTTPAPIGGMIFNCGAGGTCFANYADGSQVSLLAAAAKPGSDFVGWGGDCSAAGNAAIASVQMSTDRQCSAEFVLEQYRVGGIITGLSSGSVVLQLDSNGTPATQTRTLSASGTFQFSSALDFGSSYLATVATQPAGLTCSIAGAAGIVPAADVSSIDVTCSATAHLVGASVATGLGTVLPEFQTIANGGTATLTLQPAPGWAVQSINGTCAAGSLVGTSYRSGTVTAPCDIVVNFAIVPGNDPICRVAVDGLAGNDGASWATPKELHAALADTGCGELWVKAGVYRPSTPTSVPASDRTRSFHFPRDLTLYGGFAGNEVLLSQRDPASNRTILSGDIGGDDRNLDGNFIAEAAFQSSIISGDIVGNNSYNVVTMAGFGNASITAATIIDGVTITAGQSNGTSVIGFDYRDGGGLRCFAADTASECSPTLIDVDFHGNSAIDYGGAMINWARGSNSVTSPTLIRVRFGGNFAPRGGAMSNQAEGPNSSAGGVNRSSPRLTDVSFINNEALSEGGAIYNRAAQVNAHSSPELSRVTFSGNRADDGGAMYLYAVGSNAVVSPVVEQSTFSGNSARRGGAIRIRDSNATIDMAPVFRHVTFVGNSAQLGGAMYILNFDSHSAEVDVTLEHVILWQNTATEGGQEIYMIIGQLSLAHTIVTGGCFAGGGNVSDPIAVNNGSILTCGAGIVTGDPQLGPLQDNGGITRTHLPGTGSSAIDSGNNATCAASDQRGVTRPQDGDGNGSAICDIGAVEVVPNRSLSVTVLGTGSGEVSADPVPAPLSGSILDCGSGGSCSAVYAGGSNVTLLATAGSANSIFTGWGGDCSSAGTTPMVQVALQANRSCSASFTLRPAGNLIFRNGFD